MSGTQDDDPQGGREEKNGWSKGVGMEGEGRERPGGGKVVGGWEERKKETRRNKGRGAQWGKARDMGRRGGHWGR